MAGQPADQPIHLGLHAQECNEQRAKQTVDACRKQFDLQEAGLWTLSHAVVTARAVSAYDERQRMPT
jgi:hypothetical protein